jgi:hypothetical protein
MTKEEDWGDNPSNVLLAWGCLKACTRREERNAPASIASEIREPTAWGKDLGIAVKRDGKLTDCATLLLRAAGECELRWFS